MANYYNFILPQKYGYVFGVLGGSFFMNTFLMIQVANARKEFKVDYPHLYAPEGHENKEKFDCIQRAHQNTLESYPMTMLQMVVGGLVYPVWASLYGGIYCIGRVIYGLGYAKGPKGRMYGAIISHLGDIPLFGMMLKIAYDMISKDK